MSEWTCYKKVTFYTMHATVIMRHFNSLKEKPVSYKHSYYLFLFKISCINFRFYNTLSTQQMQKCNYLHLKSFLLQINNRREY